MTETERENIREPTLEGLDTASYKDTHGGRPPRLGTLPGGRGRCPAA